MIRRVLKYILAIAAVSTVIIILFSRKKPDEVFLSRDYEGIIESGLLKAVTEYNAINFFVEDGKICGFDYELLSAFATEKGIKLAMTPEMSFEKRLKGVSEGRYDMIALGTATTTQLKDSLLFTHPLTTGKQILVQRKDKETHIKNTLDMGGKTIYVIKDSPAMMRINNLMNEIADTIEVKGITEYGPEQLIAMVSAGDIDYAVCDEITAKAYADNYDNIDLDTDISFNQFYSWGVSRNAPVLLDSLNSWLERYKSTDEYKALCEKYFNRQK